MSRSAYALTPAIESVDSFTRGSAGVSANASPNVKGNWAGLVASLSEEVSSITIEAYHDTAGRSFLVDIGVGGLGAETVFIPNILFPSRAYMQSVTFPVRIPAGTRVSARAQCSTGGAALDYVCCFFGHPTVATGGAISEVEALGVNTATSLGTSIDCGGSANTDTAWQVLVSSTARDSKWLLVKIDPRNNTGYTNQSFLLDIGIGGAGAETVVISDIAITGSAGSLILTPGVMLFPLKIAAGTRVVARAQCSITDATDRIMGVSAYAIA